MQKVLIVDDDTLMRVSLKTMVDWDAHGFIICGDAQNGEEALRLAQSAHPDIVITDMKMPVMDGVELIRALNRCTHTPKILVLSSYDDYALVREAMKQGAVDYLLKLDLTAETLLQALNQIRPAARGISSDLSVSMRRQQLLHHILHRELSSDEDLWQQMNWASVSLSDQRIWCMALKSFALMDDSIDEDFYRTRRVSFVSIVEEIVCERMNAFCIEGQNDGFYVLGTFRDQTEDRKDVVSRLMQRVHDMLEAYMDISVFIGISSGKCRAEGLSAACIQADRMANDTMQYGEPFISFWEENAGILNDTQNYDVYPFQSQIALAISVRDEKMASEAIEQIISDVQTGHLSRLTRLQIALDMISGLRNSLRESGIDHTSVFLRSSGQIEQLVKLQTREEFLNWLRLFKTDICSYIAGSKTESQKEVFRAQQYIDQHFSEEISLSDLADMLHLTPGYLSSMMKKQLGMSFLEYLIHVRIEEAKKLLAKSNVRVYEAAERVGYSNQFYFGRLFKREVGISPGQYRRNVLDKEETR